MSAPDVKPASPYPALAAALPRIPTGSGVYLFKDPGGKVLYIGKAVNHEIEGPHAVVGAELIKRYGESEAVVNGVASHHSDVPPIGPLGHLVSAADAISASRPGARSESMTTYLKRIEDLEKIANEFKGVANTYAIQAGRELRVIVESDKVTDDEAFLLSKDIARKIEEALNFPGQIKVTVIRETRAVELANSN